MYALMGVSPMEAAARIKKQLIDTIGTIAARGHAQLLLARLSALAPIAAQRGNTTNSNQQIISLNALARAHYRRSIGTRGGDGCWCARRVGRELPSTLAPRRWAPACSTPAIAATATEMGAARSRTTPTRASGARRTRATGPKTRFRASFADFWVKAFDLLSHPLSPASKPSVWATTTMTPARRDYARSPRLCPLAGFGSSD
ncbi:hypothetical protein T492DRAFT_875083 [Pavlovales sp. CCMP2436]|nr:hypothetical protein T492DRAFT_875083 [Pavlovales sp. CCMP2436]